MRRPAIPHLALAGLTGAALATAVFAAPTEYQVDSNHTYPSFEADHMGGVSKWRGKINSTSGSITLDKEAESGMVDVTMDMTSIDFGHDGLNEHAQTADIFDVAQYPTAEYTGELVDWQDGAPTAAEGELTLHGMTQPVRLTINSFKCQPHPQRGVEVCGADAETQIDRSEFGVNFGQNFGFNMDVILRIQIEALESSE